MPVRPEEILREPDMDFLRHGPLGSRQADANRNYQSRAVIQYQHFTALTYRLARAGLWALLGICLQVSHADAATASEQANLEVMIRQLNALEDTARRSAQVADEPGKRYFFDYQRLAGDIERIRHGLEGYLTPSRAQPRDPAEVSGNYTLTGGRKP
jgi:RAQPRD family integrative conjugative element protein